MVVLSGDMEEDSAVIYRIMVNPDNDEINLQGLMAIVFHFLDR